MRRDKCPAGTSWCYCCEQIKPLDAFYKDVSRSNGKCASCIECQSGPPITNQYQTYMELYSTRHPEIRKSRWDKVTSPEVRAATAARKIVLDGWDAEYQLKLKAAKEKAA